MDIAALEKMSKQTILNLVMVLGFMAHGYATMEFEVRHGVGDVQGQQHRLTSITLHRSHQIVLESTCPPNISTIPRVTERVKMPNSMTHAFVVQLTPESWKLTLVQE